MSRTVSPTSGRPYGLARVCRIWRASRATLYRHLRRDHITASQHRDARTRAFKVWAEVSGTAAAA